MPLEKPKKPTELVPRAFGGIKNNFSDDLQSTGFEPNIPQTYNGDNLNYHLDATGKELDYVEKVVDFINQAPVNHIPFVNENNQLDYVDASSLGSGAFDMFDTKISDHILTDKEAKGWALQGTFVSGALYPDFYNRCLEEYTNAPVKVQDWTQPVTTGNTTTTQDGNIVCTASSQYSDAYSAWKALDGVLSGKDAWASAQTITAGWWQVKFPYKLKITGLTFYSSHGSDSNYFAKDCQFFTSSDMTTPIGDAFVGSSSEYVATVVQNIPQEGIITDTIYLNITSAHSTGIGMGGLVIEAQKVGDVVLYQNPNGHQFYNILDKEIVDGIFEQYGIADFYGVDEENERIFLPRNKWFAIKGSVDSVPVYGNGMTIGLTYGNNKNAGLVTWTNTTFAAANIFQDAYGTNVGVNATVNIAEGHKTLGVTTDPTKSGIIADTSNVVQPNENRYLYYCVGNTVVNDAEIDAGALVAQMEQKANIFLDNILPSQDFKTQSISWGMPDYTAGVSITLPYTAPKDGVVWLSVQKTSASGTGGATYYINGAHIYTFSWYSGHGRGTTIVPIAIGDVLTVDSDVTNAQTFFPMKGAN